MKPEDIRKLLGGYATGTLTPEEEQALFAAALEDQELFDALAREQSLRDLLRDPSAKAQVLAALDQPKPGWLARWWRPVALAGASVAVATLVFVAVKPRNPQALVRRELIATVQVQPPAPPQPAIPAPRREVAPRPASAPLTRNGPPSAADAEERLQDRLRRDENQNEKKPVAKELDGPVRDAVAETASGGGGGGRGGRGGVIGGVVSGVAGVAAPAILASPPAPPPPAGAVGKQVEAIAESAPSAAPTVAIDNASIQALKSRASGTGGARALFMQSFDSANQLMSKDGAAAPVQQAQSSQQAAPAQQQGEPRQKVESKSGFASLQDLRAAVTPVGPVGVRYTILPGADTPSVRLEPNAAGHLSVWARVSSGPWRIVQASPASILMPVTVKLAAGERDVLVWFSRDPGSRSPQEPPPAAAESAAVRTEGPRNGDPATYVVNLNAGASDLRFNIAVR